MTTLSDFFERISMNIIEGHAIIWTEHQAPGALPNGTRVEKRNAMPGDRHGNGAPATILGSIGPVDGDVYGYFVQFDDEPGIPVGISSPRVRPIKEKKPNAG